jgi:hypothetical protein
MGLYREWTTKMYPYQSHEEVMKKVKKLSKTRAGPHRQFLSTFF